MMTVRAARHFDIVMLAAAMALAAYGALLIYSASLNTYPEGISGLDHPVAKQAALALTGVLITVVVAWTDYRVFGQIAPGVYAMGVLLLIVVLLAGDTAFGSRRWITLGSVQLQPSEVAKLLTIIALARFLADRPREMGKVKNFFLTLAIVGLPMTLVMAEPDMGTAIIFGAIWLGMMMVGGAKPQHILIFLAFLVLAIPFVTLAVLGDYQRERIALFLNPNLDPLGGGFNILQAEIGVGSGGLLGKGLTEGTQTQLNFLQTPTTDYIFSVLGEELGLVGALVMFALFILLLFRGLRAASMARDQFGKLVATGIVIMILFQVFINVAVNIRLLPVTGIPLPFMSQGGSSLLTLFVSLGLLQGVLLRHKQIDFDALKG
ncbi:MAG: rod shape-determining protein RodA [Chloroflexi bacterium]|nr:rod shape-determining protein RodA [Chloroflexota bacterium]